MSAGPPHEFVRAAVAEFRKQKALGEGAFAQVDDSDLSRVDVEGGNSIAILVRHLAGNMRSRWTDMLTTDGEKPDRDRDREFDATVTSRAEMEQIWRGGWACLFDGLNALTATDLEKIIFIRGEPHSVTLAVVRQLTHHAYHVGQIVQMARRYVGPDWKTLSIARGESHAFYRIGSPVVR